MKLSRLNVIVQPFHIFLLYKLMQFYFLPGFNIDMKDSKFYVP